ncbi:apolipoprotein N-acyltransferase [Celerinatantimonas sp. YJH-8]|uniref:apolipoprotein N-acyltransferase n=1 Tax=Celerinatantimonas sp. YJH-8 TaxID=3228714 RepID=UPI0038C52A5F
MTANHRLEYSPLVLIQKPFIACLIALLAGLLAPFAFAPYHLWPLSILSMAGLFFLIQRVRTPFRIGFCYAIGFYGYGLSWIHVSIYQFGGIPLWGSFFLVGLLVIYLALFPAFSCWLAAKWPSHHSLTFALLGFPGCWLLGEWLRARLFTGFPWLMPGYSQIYSPLSGYASSFGVYGVTLVLLCCAGLLVCWLSRPRHLISLIVLALIVSGGTLLKWVTFTHAHSPVRIALVQGNEAIETKWAPENRMPTLKRYWQLTEQQNNTDIIVWPESALPLLESQASAYLTALDQTLTQKQQALVTGIIHRSATGQYYNALIVLGQKTKPGSHSAPYQFNNQDRYYKRHLLPIGEFVPFEKWLRPLAKLFNLPMSSFSRGTNQQSDILVNGHHWLSAICYEIAFGNEIQSLISQQTDAILTISNDTWFGRSIGPAQHLEIAQMRALEFQRPVVRGTNTGYTALINSHGQITKQLPIYKTAVLHGEMTPRTGQTPYQRWGLWPVYLFEFIAAMLMIQQIRSRIKLNKVQIQSSNKVESNADN